MYCEKCGAEMDEEDVFCEKCGAQSHRQILNQPSSYNAQTYEKRENVIPIFVAEKAIATRNGIIVVAVLDALFSFLVCPLVLMSIEEKASSVLAEMKYSSFESYIEISRLENKIASMHLIFIIIIVVCVVLALFTIAIDIFRAIRIHNTILMLTNVGIVGNTGNVFNNKSLNALFHEITNATLRKGARRYGWIDIEIEFVEKYSFFIKEPSNFLYYLNEQMKKISDYKE